MLCSTYSLCLKALLDNVHCGFLGRDGFPLAFWHFNHFNHSNSKSFTLDSKCEFPVQRVHFY